MKIALIPARSGSKRIGGKNIKPLAGHPLIAYTICAALQSGVFNRVLVSTDSAEYGSIAQTYGADVIMRPPEFATDVSPDIDWVTQVMSSKTVNGKYEIFSILRPTSPFRQPKTIIEAMEVFRSVPCDSLRAVAPCGEHPGKQWLLNGPNPYMTPLLLQPPQQPFHSSQKAALPKVYTQTSGLEIAWTKQTVDQGTIAGERIVPFLMEGPEAHDLNTPEDWVIAEHYLANGAKLPEVKTVA